MPRPLKVFLCHAHSDKPAVWKLHRYLKQRGISPWLDQADLLPGQNWEVEIPKALFTSDVILVCLSKNSINKEGYVQKEIAFALDKAMEKPRGTIFIIPVKLEECEVPKRLSPYQWVDYFRPDGRKRLLMGLSLRASSIGDDVFPIVFEDTRKPKTSPKPIVHNDGSAKLDLDKLELENAVKGIREVGDAVVDLEGGGVRKRVNEAKQPERKYSQKKPFTKFLDPSSLNSSPPQKNRSQPDYRRYGIVEVISKMVD